MMFGQHVDRNYVAGKGKYRPCITEQITAAMRQFPSMESAQIFVAGPRNRKITLLDDEVARLSALKFPVVTHSTYPTTTCWLEGGTGPGFECVMKECELTAKFHGVGVVIHLPKQPPAAIKPTLDKFVAKLVGNMRLIIETPAHVPPDTYYSTVADLRKLVEMIPAVSRQHFGICIDTAHLWVCGIHLNEVPVMATFLKELDVMRAETGIFIMWHLNDSKNQCGCGPDAHEIITRGHIWEHDESSLKLLISYIVEHNDVAIFELHDDDHRDLTTAYDVLNTLI